MDAIKYFYEVELLTVQQNKEQFYIGKININWIKNLFTVSPAEYAISSIISNYDINDPEIGDQIKKLRSIKSDGYQRIEVKDRVKEIAEYVAKVNEYHIIPNSIIMALNAEVIKSKNELNQYIETDQFVILQKEVSGYSTLFIPKKLVKDHNEEYKPIFVIDGNHRMMGIKKYVEDNSVDLFEIVATFLVNCDKVEQAEMFKTINYKIKRVNKSYYYQIMGEFEEGQNEYIYLHYLTRLFNEAENSPLYSRIKMLGTSYNGINKQTISQAFFVEHLYEWIFAEKRKFNFKNQPIAKRIPVLRPFYVSGNEKIATKILVKYFLALKRVFNKRYTSSNITWDSDDNLLLKPIGIGAFIEIFPIIYICLSKEKGLLYKLDELTNIDTKDLTPYLEKIFFGMDVLSMISHNFLKGSGKGIIVEFANTLVPILINDNYFETEKAYCDWLKNAIN